MGTLGIPPGTPLPEQPLIRGRERELETIAALVGGSRPQAWGLVIEGEAGIGKTRLLDDAVRIAGQSGRRVLSAVCAQPESEMGLATLGDILGDIIDEFGPALPHWQRNVLDPALGRTSGIAGPPDRRALGLATLALLRAAMADRPILIAVDDLQWLDRSTASVLAFALRRLGGDPLVLAVTFRSALNAIDPLDLDRVFGDRLERLFVPPLDERSVRALVRDRLRPLTASDVRWVLESSEGNPLAALVLGRLITQTADGSDRRGRLPGTLEAGLRGRLAELSDDVLDLLVVVSAAARPTTALLVRAGIQGGNLRRMIANAERTGVLRADGDRLRFTHPLYRSAVYEQATETARAAAHRRLATACDDVEERARHLALADSTRDEELARVLMSAAQSAAARGALASAAELADLAVDRTPLAETNVAIRAMAASSYHFQAGECHQARVMLDEAIRHTPPGVARAEAYLRRSQYEGNDVPVMARFLELGFDDMPAAGEDGLRASLHADMTYVGVLGGDLSFGLEHAERARVISVRSGDLAAVARAAVALVYATFLRGRRVEAFEATAIAHEQALAGMDLQASARTVSGAVAMWSGELERARSTLERERELMETRGQFALLWEVLVYLAELEVRAGRWDLARQYASEGARTLEESGIDQAREVHLWSTALVAAHCGEVETSRASAAEGLRIAESHGDVFHVLTNRSVLGFVELSVGDPAAADRWLGPLPGIAARMKLEEPGAFPFWPDAIEAKVALGDLAGARTLVETLQTQGEQCRRVSALAAAARCRGMLAAAEGRLEEAERELRMALAHHREVAQPFDEARSRLVLGQVLRRRKQKRSATTALREAETTFATLGSPLWRARAEHDLQRVGGRPASSQELTATERAIARLVARGQRDADIARELFMSEHTVGDNLKRIYRKLSVRSRAELAARASTLDLD